ncbi:MAG: TRM11 family SAM-dependent methyltransferase [Clostridium sp.]|uniref:TRM11 family SAM-dependent methyltransferase n=1 Tax=Clostridium sp. TaxID=1506 RepID=UPI003EE4C7DE
MMNRYMILANPGHNRIYFDTALKIAYFELKAILEAREVCIEEIFEGDLGLPASICFNTKERLKEEDFIAISTASIYYAIFEIVEGNLLKPIIVKDFRTFPESMVQILKYTGKTNEQFTRLMVNLALSACKTGSKKIKLIDPMCGKGTTLYEGLIRGFDVIGIEINAQWIQEIQNYIVRYLKLGKYKHKAQKEKRSGIKGKKIADCFIVDMASTKEDFICGNTQNLNLFLSDTRNANLLLKRNSCDILVSDLPYGVQHGSKAEGDSTMDRSPLELLKNCIPAWQNVLKVKGALCISFNEFTLKYEDVREVLEENNFTVLDEEPFNGYIHRVDQAINRNLIVAVKNK